MTLLDPPATDHLLEILLHTTVQEYPHHLSQELHSDADLRPPRELNPAFFGCYDWHSAVHSHWTLVRCVHRDLAGGHRDAVVTRLDEHLAPEPVAGELAFFTGHGGRTSHRPYGWAWLVMLHAECAAESDADSQRWAQALAPLADYFNEALLELFERVAFPLRIGTHGNTAFSVQLSLEAARRRGDTATADALIEIARRRFAADPSFRWSDAPAGDAFLTPSLVEASMLADALSQDELVVWLERVLPDVAHADWRVPRFSPDGKDPGTVHLEGLLVSRAWALHTLIRALPDGHPFADRARPALAAHLERVAAIDPSEGFNRSHWLPTYLLYLDDRLGR